MGWIAGVGVCPMKAKLPKPDLLQGSIKSIELLLWPNAMERDLAHKVARQSRKDASNEWPLHPKKLTFGEGTGRSAMCHSTKSLRDSPLRGESDREHGSRGQDRR
jgi:hypothetical protein